MKKNIIISISAGIFALVSAYSTIVSIPTVFNTKEEITKEEITKEEITKEEIVSLYNKGKLIANLYNLLSSYPWLENKLKETNDFESFKKDKQFEITQKLNELSKEEQSLIKKTLEKPSLSESYLKYIEYDLNEELNSFFEIIKVFGDLNNDGIPELVFDYPAYCGSGGCTFPIYQINIRDKTINLIGYTSDANMESSIAKDKINGWYPIIYEHRIGSTYYETLLVFENGKYIEKGTLENNINEKGDMYEVKNGDKIIKYTPVNLSEQQ